MNGFNFFKVWQKLAKNHFLSKKIEPINHENYNKTSIKLKNSGCIELSLTNEVKMQEVYIFLFGKLYSISLTM